MWTIEPLHPSITDYLDAELLKSLAKYRANNVAYAEEWAECKAFTGGLLDYVMLEKVKDPNEVLSPIYDSSGFPPLNDYRAFFSKTRCAFFRLDSTKSSMAVVLACKREEVPLA